MDIVQFFICLDESSYDLITIITATSNTAYAMDEIPSIMRYSYDYRIRLISNEIKGCKKILVLYLENKNDSI